MAKTKAEKPQHKLATASYNTYQTPSTNPWNDGVVDRFDTLILGSGDYSEFRKTVKDCRFFYRRDAMASSVINKMLELSMSGLRISQGNLKDNQYRIFKFVQDDLEDFIEKCALEWLISGLVIPEFEFDYMTPEELAEAGIKSLKSVRIPRGLWLRDPDVIQIKSPPIGNRESYFQEVPQKLVTFLKNKGMYENGEKDLELYNEIITLYPDFVKEVLSGKVLFKINDPIAIKRRVLSDNPYPTPFLAPALESLKHKRNIRRMDYSLAARAMTAIQQFAIGSDEFPVGEDDTDIIDDLKLQLQERESINQGNIERIFQLFTNHTVDIKWIIPDMQALLSRDKYEEINLDILQALGFPKILITGEVQRTGTTDADIAILSPIKTMEYLRRQLIRVIRRIFYQIGKENSLTDIPEVDFEPINLVSFRDYATGMGKLYESGNLDRTAYTKVFGVVHEDSARQLAKDNELREELGLEDFAPLPHSNSPGNPDSEEE